MTLWYSCTAVFLFLRFTIACTWLVAGGAFGIVLALSEFLVLLQGLWNLRTAKAFDTSLTGLAIPAAYLLGVLLVPVQSSDSAVYVPALVALVLAQILVRGWQGRSLTVAGASWVSCVQTGPYALVRHPQYTLCIVTRVLALLAWPCWFNLGVVLAYAFALFIAALREERFCLQFAEYRAYASRVRWRLLPGVV
jgi:protein-S-isoprenylcysteine O-methyltransferase Ste14